jgi:ubiquinone/menaquinone biosynthesis C-methylase UbiE
MNYEIIVFMKENMNDSINKFSDKAKDYAKYRLDYSVEILQFLNDYNFCINSVIADVGSGTGKLTKIFLENGNTVYAVEPNDNMRNMANSLLNGFKNFISINGSAENTTLQSGIIDFVVVGQAFHWFDAPKALNEFKRILKKNGLLVLIWYSRKTDTPFWNEYENILKSNISDYKGNIHRNYSDEIIEDFLLMDYKKIKFENNRELTFTELLGSFSSSSYSPKEETQEYNDIYKLLDKIFNDYKTNDKILCNYETEIYIGRL